VSGYWRTPSNWTPAGGPPTASDAATIDGSGTYTVTVRKADVADSLTLSDANATLNVGGPRASLTIGGALTISDGTLNVSPYLHGGSLTVGALDLSGGSFSMNAGRRAQAQRNAQPDGRNAYAGRHDLGRHDRFDRGGR
jgi:hypothetical protein